MTRVRSVRTREYRRLLDCLPKHVVELAELRYRRVFSVNPEHPMLEGKRVPDRRRGLSVWRITVGDGYRALAVIEETATIRTFVWYWIGTHEAYNGRVGTGK